MVEAIIPVMITRALDSLPIAIPASHRVMCDGSTDKEAIGGRSALAP